MGGKNFFDKNKKKKNTIKMKLSFWYNKEIELPSTAINFRYILLDVRG